MMKTRIIFLLAITSFLLPEILNAGMIVVKNEKGEYGGSGYAYVYNSEPGLKACREEIKKMGSRGPACEDLSFPVKDGTIVKPGGIAYDGYRYVTITKGPLTGKGGLVSVNCYVDVEE